MRQEQTHIHTHVEGVESTASIAGHPLHPMMIPFPIAFLTGALVTDIVYWITAADFWARVSLWLIVGGLVMGVLAAGLGAIDFFTIDRVRALTSGWIHAGVNVAVIIFALANLWLRWGDPAAAVWPAGVILSAITTVLLGVSGWYGGELSYRHKVGVIETS